MIGYTEVIQNGVVGSYQLQTVSGPASVVAQKPFLPLDLK
jgi:hypothetical protein